MVVPLQPLVEYGNAACIPQIFWKLKDYDVWHLHYPFLGATLAVVLAKLVWKKKLVVTYHMDLVGGGLFHLFFRAYTACILPLIMKSADRILVTSYDYAESGRLKKLFFQYREKISELPNSVDTAVFAPRQCGEYLQNRYRLSSKTNVILFVGGLDSAHYFKGVDILIEAFSTLTDPTLCLVIGGDGDLRTMYERQAHASSRSHDIHFAGRISQDELPDYYAFADCVVLPSIDQSEAFGVVLIEAMACAKPVITTNLPGVRSVVRDGINGLLVEKKSVYALSQALTAMFADQEKMKVMGSEGKKIVEQRYSNEVVEKEFARIFGSL